jgi:hypothetical protein
MALGMALAESLIRGRSMTTEFRAPGLDAQRRALDAALVMPDLEPCSKR